MDDAISGEGGGNNCSLSSYAYCDEGRRIAALRAVGRGGARLAAMAEMEIGAMHPSDLGELDMTMGGTPWRRRLQRSFRREGEYWSVKYRGTVCRLRDSKGMQYLALLLAHPGVGIKATDLSRCVDHGTLPSTPVLAPTKGALESSNGKRNGENARVRVTRAITAALTRIAQHHPPLGAHLKATIRTGAACVYLPDPHGENEWDV